VKDISRDQLAANMLEYSRIVNNLLKKIDILESNNALTLSEKSSQLKIINEEIKKVGIEVASIKNMIILSDKLSIN
jgi:hypothetical protein